MAETCRQVQTVTLQLEKSPQGDLKMNHFIRLIAIILTVAIIISCSKDNGNNSNPIAPQATADISGKWIATITVTGGEQMPVGTEYSVIFTYTQSGSNVTGNFVTEGGLTGQITGTVNGNNFTFTLTQNNPCPGTFNGSGTINESEDQISGSYTGSDTNGTMEAQFTAVEYEENISGTWLAVVTVTEGEQIPVGTKINVTFTIIQSDSNVTGSYVSEYGITGQLTGTIDGEIFTFTMTQNYPNPGTFNGSGIINEFGDQIIGAYTGSDSYGYMEVQFTAVRM